MSASAVVIHYEEALYQVYESLSSHGPRQKPLDFGGNGHVTLGLRLRLIVGNAVLRPTRETMTLCYQAFV